MQKNFIRLRYSNEFQSNNYDFQTKAAELAKVSRPVTVRYLTQVGVRMMLKNQEGFFQSL